MISGKKWKKQIFKVQQETRKTYNLRQRSAIWNQIGDLVAIKRTQIGLNLKLKAKFFGPYNIVKIKEGNTFDVSKEGYHEGPHINLLWIHYTMGNNCLNRKTVNYFLKGTKMKKNVCINLLYLFINNLAVTNDVTFLCLFVCFFFYIAVTENNQYVGWLIYAANFAIWRMAFLFSQSFGVRREAKIEKFIILSK